MNDSATVAQLIRERMKAYGISNKQLADDIQNVNVNTIAQLAKGREISYVTFANIADYLDCSVDYLLGRTDNPDMTITVSDNTQNNINGNNSIQVSTKQHDEMTDELFDLIQSLPLVKKAEAIIYLNELKTKE